MTDIITVGVGVAGFVLGLGANLFVFGWRAKTVEANLRQDMTAAVTDLREDMNAAVSKFSDTLHEEHEVLRKEHDNATADNQKAVKELNDKLFKVELWCRDNFVRRDDFAQVIDGVTRSVEGIAVKLDNAVLRIENKIEKLRDSDRN